MIEILGTIIKALEKIIILIGLLISGLEVPAELPMGAEAIMPSVEVNGQLIEFPYTDNNSNENLIIRTDRKEYGAGDDIYLAIENKSKRAQKIYLYFFFADETKKITEIAEFKKNVPHKIVIENTTTTCSTSTKEVYSTSTNATTTKIITTCQEVIISTSTEIRYRDEWQEKKLFNFIETEYQKLTASSSFPLKDKKGYKTQRKFELLLPEKTIYLKAKIEAPLFLRAKEEFFIEILGDKGGYGHLR